MKKSNTKSKVKKSLPYVGWPMLLQPGETLLRRDASNYYWYVEAWSNEHRMFDRYDDLGSKTYDPNDLMVVRMVVRLVAQGRSCSWDFYAQRIEYGKVVWRTVLSAPWIVAKYSICA